MNRNALAGTALALAMAALTTVWNGELVDRDDFPATCELDAEGVPPCTCVLVGPEAVLTAAHCIGANDRTAKVGLFRQPEVRAENCQISTTLDLAICRVSTVRDIRPERISTRPPAEGEDLLLTGFGCSSSVQLHPPRRLRMDSARVSSLPGSDNFIGFEDGGLCSGDSGGPAFSLGSADHLGSRLVVGINSKNSHLTSVSTLPAQQFIRRWADDNNVGVCGIRESRGLPCRE